MTGWWGRQMVIGACVAVAAIGCAGSDGPEPAEPLESAEPLTTPAATDPPTTTVDSVAEPDDGDTSTTTTTTTTTSTTTTEPAPTTTTLEDLRQEIEADLNEGEQALVEGGATPANSAAVERLSEFYSGQALEAVRNIYSRLASAGHIVLPGAVESRSVVIDILESSDGSATIRRCRIDAGVVVLEGDPTEVVDDEVARSDGISQVVLDDGRWKLAGGETLSTQIGVASCE